MKRTFLLALFLCGTLYAYLTPGGSGGGGTWGSITGTLSSQTDLNTALGLKAPAASPTLTGTVTATAMNAGVAANSLTLSTTDNLSGSTSDLIFSTGDASVTGGNTSGAFLFAEGNSATTKGIQVYNRDAGIGYSYTQMDYSGIRMPSNGSITAQSGQFFIGIPSVEGFGLGHSNGINTYGHLVDAFGDTAFIGGEASNGIYPFNRLYIGSGGIVVGAVTSGPGTVYAPLNALDIRGAAGAAYAQYTDTATGSTSADGTLVGIDSSGNFIVNQQENLALTLKTNGSSRISINGSGTINVPGLTASRVLTTDGSSNLAAASVTTTTLAFLDATSSIQTQINTKLPTTGVGLVDVFTGFIESPTDKTYVLDQSAAYAYTINTLIVATVSGTTTAAVKINGTNVTGISAVSVSSTPATGTASAANSVAIGDKVTLVLSSSSTPVDLSFTLKYTR